MSYACDYRQGEVGHILCQCKGVEPREIAGSTTATDDDHTIPILIFGINTVEGSDDTLLYALALHSGSKKARLELQAIIVAGKLITEIAITGSRGTRHYRNALAEHRESQFLLQIEDTFFFQRPNDFLSLTSHIAHRIVGVYVVDDP